MLKSTLTLISALIAMATSNTNQKQIENKTQSIMENTAYTSGKNQVSFTSNGETLFGHAAVVGVITDNQVVPC